MTKKLLAIAIAAAVAAPVAMADTTVYGKMHYSWDFVSNDFGGADDSDSATGVSRASRFGVKGSEDLGGGMKAVFQIENQINAGTIGSRNTFVGLAGGFGTVLMGRHDTPYKMSTGSLDMFGDTVGDYNSAIGTANGRVLFDERAGGTVAYVSPAMGGAKIVAAYVSVVADEGAGADDTNAYSLAAMYNNGPITAALAYEAYSDGAAALQNSSGLNVPGAGTDTGSSAMKAGVGFKFGAAKVGGVYEVISSDGKEANGKDGQTNYMVNAAFGMGNNTVKAQYAVAGEYAETANTGSSELSVGLDHKFSKRTKAYVIYNQVDSDAANSDSSTISLGLVHKF